MQTAREALPPVEQQAEAQRPAGSLRTTFKQLAAAQDLARQLRGTALAVGFFPFVMLAHELALVLLARLLSSGFGQAVGARAAGLGDAVYARLAVGMIDGAQLRGLAVRLPFQAWLTGSGRFLGAADLPSGKLFGVVFDANSSAVGVQVAQVLANVIAITAGAMLFAAFRTSKQRWAVLGGVLTVYGAGSELQLPWADGGGGQIVLSLVATKVLGISSGLFDAAMRMPAATTLAVNLLIALLAACLGWLAWAVISSAIRHAWPAPRSPAFEQLLLPAAVTLGLVFSPLQYGIGFDPPLGALAPPVEPQVAAAEPVAVQPAAPAETGSDTAASAPVPAVPVTVTIDLHDGAFRYLVDGRQETVRGVGYDPVLAGQSPAQRAARFDRDFELMHDIGANTITGWNEDIFDSTLLAAAARHDMGVVVPFDLKPSLDYQNPQVRQQLLTAIAARVQAYKDAPALRMWGLGNEVLHDMPKNKPRTEPAAFASFLIQAADAVHAADPNHPVLYRDAEDGFLDPIARALKADGKARPWFVYGMNFFTDRMDEALTKGPASRLGQPLLISEFGPVGLIPQMRESGYRAMWKIIRAHTQLVLGGCAYVWSTDGPEALDSSFGLTDPSGQAVDSSLYTLASLFVPLQAEEMGGLNLLPAQ